MNRWRLEVAAWTHQGAVRTRHEDALLIGGDLFLTPMATPVALQHALNVPFLLAVLDGMGGHARGDVASAQVARGLQACAEMLDSGAALEAALHRLNAELYAEMDRHPACRGMGTTVVGLLYLADGVVVFNVGDSRAYLQHGSFLRQLSHDDTSRGPRRMGLTQALGGADHPTVIEVHHRTLPLDRDRVFLLCSDGLSDVLSPDALEAALDADLSGGVTALVEAALLAGGPDNVTAVLVQLVREP